MQGAQVQSPVREPRSHMPQFSSVQLLIHVRLFSTPWIAAHQSSLSITNSQSSLKLTPIKSVMPSSHLILCRPLFLLPPIPPSIRVFSNESTLTWGGRSIGVSASAPVLQTNTQDRSSLGWTGWIFLQSKGLSRVFSKENIGENTLWHKSQQDPLWPTSHHIGNKSKNKQMGCN